MSSFGGGASFGAEPDLVDPTGRIEAPKQGETKT